MKMSKGLLETYEAIRTLKEMGRLRSLGLEELIQVG
jgi:hypothetical protein